MFSKALHAGNFAASFGIIATAAADLTLFGGATTGISALLSAHELIKKDKSLRPMITQMGEAFEEAVTASPLSVDHKKLIPQLMEKFPITEDDLAKGALDAKQTATLIRAKIDAKAPTLDPALAHPRLIIAYEAILTQMLTPVLKAPEGTDPMQWAINKQILSQSAISGATRRLFEAGITENALIQMAQKITADTTDVAQAWNELQNAVERHLRLQSEGTKGSNHGGFADTVLAQAVDLAKDGDYDTASATLDAAYEQIDAQKDRIFRQHIEFALLNRDTAKAATLLIRQTDLDAGGMATFETLRSLRNHYYETGREKGSNLDSALAIDLAEQVLNRATTADQRGTAQNDLGTALATLGARESGKKRLELAVAAYDEALKERTQARVPLDWAMTQNNLGAALQVLGRRESGTKRLEQAIVAFEEALKERPQTRVPLERATTQNNLGNALAILGERENGTKRLEQAIVAFEEALKERTQTRAPLERATTQNNLGNALAALGERESGTKRLEQAVVAFEDALKECTQARVPLQWATTQISLGSAFHTLGKRESGTKRLEQAVAAYTEALTEHTRDRVPFQWAMTQMNLGNTLQTLGERERGTERLEQAVTAYREALKENTQARAPFQWAKTQYNLALVEIAFFDKTENPKHLARATQYVTAAREVFAAAQASHYLEMADIIIAAIPARKS